MSYQELTDLVPLLLVAAMMRGVGARTSTTTHITAGRDISSGNVTTTVTVQVAATQARDRDVK